MKDIMNLKKKVYFLRQVCTLGNFIQITDSTIKSTVLMESLLLQNLSMFFTYFRDTEGNK